MIDGATREGAGEALATDTSEECVNARLEPLRTNCD